MISEDIAAGIAAGAVGVGYAVKWLMSKVGSGGGGDDVARERNLAQNVVIRSLRDEILRLNDLVGSLGSKLDDEIYARRGVQDENGRLSRKVLVLELEVRRLGGTIG
jgi:hypothetical protein